MSISYRTWHRAYCRWYDHRDAGHRTRAAAWGWIADRLVNAANAMVRLGVPVKTNLEWRDVLL